MDTKRASFVISAVDLKGCPHTTIPEYAFFGRSNVGKSSLINMLTGVKGLAKTSSTPGKTQLLNFFSVDNNTWHLVDLPGYGYAKVAKSARKNWEIIIRNYLLKRKPLLYTFILVDSRHEPLSMDLELITWMGENGLPFCLVYTKGDKLSRNGLIKNINSYKNELKEKWEELPPIFITSSQSGEGKAEINDFISKTNAEYSTLLSKSIT